MSATLKGEKRGKLGSRSARVLRARGRIPACIQGEGKENLNLSIDEHEFLAARRHHEHLFDLEMDGGETETALVRELQWNALGEKIIHVEFRRVIRGQKTEAEVELEFTGHPKGGILNHLMTHVTIEALPSEIPDSIEVKVDGLEPGHPLHVRDLVLPEGVSIVGLPAEAQVAVVSVPKGEVEEEAEAEAVEEGAEAAPAPEAAPEAPSE